MESVPQWAKETRTSLNDDEIAHAGEVIRWLFARVGRRNDETFNAKHVREIADYIFSRDIRVYGAVYDSCIRHGETDSWNGFSLVFPDWDPWRPPTLDELYYVSRQEAPQ